MIPLSSNFLSIIGAENLHLLKFNRRKFALISFVKILNSSSIFLIFLPQNKLCFIDLSINLLSLSASIAHFCATSLTLNGGLMEFKALIIFYLHITSILNDANPYIFENVLNIKTFL